MREDLKPEGKAPQYVEDFFIRLAGKNPYGEAQYRMALAQDRTVKQAADWHDWDENLTMQERGGLVQDDHGRMVPSIRKPDRVVKEMRTIARYPICTCLEGVLLNKKTGINGLAGDCERCHGVRGWIIEKWVPAHLLGGEAQWYEYKLEGTDLPRLGPYPHEGIYRRVPGSKAWAEIPSLSQLADLVIWLEQRKANATGTDEQYFREMEIAKEYENRKRAEAEQQRTKEMLWDRLSPMMGNSLAAGRLRESYANKMRARGIPIGHVGA